MKTNSNHPNNTPDNIVNDSATIATDNAPFSAMLGSLMKFWRTNSNRSVYSIAKATCLSAHTINRIESGRIVNLEAVLRYLAFITRADPKNHILRDYLAATKNIDITTCLPRGCSTTEVSTTDNVAESELAMRSPDAMATEKASRQNGNWISGVKSKISGLFK